MSEEVNTGQGPSRQYGEDYGLIIDDPGGRISIVGGTRVQLKHRDFDIEELIFQPWSGRLNIRRLMWCRVPLEKTYIEPGNVPNPLFWIDYDIAGYNAEEQARRKVIEAFDKYYKPSMDN